MVDDFFACRLPGRIVAAPSWVFPGSIYENCVFLAGKVQEVGLLCYESEASLSYGEKDLPPALAELPLSWHVHLPLDLPWDNPGQAAEICLQIMDKLAFLKIRRAVLHPPLPEKSSAENIIGKLALFVERWTRRGYPASGLMLENIPAQRPALTAQAASAVGCSLCFDLAHYIMHHRSASTGAGYAARLQNWESGKLDEELAAFLPLVRLVHLCAPGLPGKKGHHRPLTELTRAEKALGAAIFSQLPQKNVFMLEIFCWKDYVDSTPVLYEWSQNI